MFKQIIQTIKSYSSAHSYWRERENFLFIRHKGVQGDDPCYPSVNQLGKNT